MIKNIRDYLYHGVTNEFNYFTTKHFKNPYCYSIAKLENILKSGYILPRETINKQEIIIPNINPDNNADVVSVAFHRSNKYFEKKYQNNTDMGKWFFAEYAYDTFLNQISIILNPSLLDDLEVRKKDYPTIIMPDEIQVIDPISIKYFEGIGLKYYFYKHERTTTKEYYNYYKYDKELRDIIKIVLNEYNFDIPIVDLETGNDLFEAPVEYKLKVKSVL